MARADRMRVYSVPYFTDRHHAGALLAEQLREYKGKGVLVLGIPRGGVLVAAEVARQLDAELDIVVARKLGAPSSPELAIGAVTANGGRFLNRDVIRALGVSQSYIQEVTMREMAEARQREARFRKGRAPAEIEGRTVVVVDDGLATGATMRAAVRSVRKRKPAHLIVAVPVGAREACTALKEECDQVVCLSIPEPFYAVGIYYAHFEPTEDAEVQETLEAFYRTREVAQEGNF